MSNSKEPKRYLVVQGLNGDHEVILRLPKRTRYVLLAVAVAIILDASGTTFSTVVEVVNLITGVGIIP